MSAQVQIKLLPHNYDTTVLVLQDRYIELYRRIQDAVEGDAVSRADADGCREQAGEIANALNDLNARVPHV